MLITFAVIIIVLGIRVVRMTREQRLRPRTMWIPPIVFALLTCAIIVFDGYTRLSDYAAMALALAVGLGIGWYQGTHTTIRVDHSTHTLFVKISPIGSLIWIGVLALRFGVRFLTVGASMPPPGGAMAGAAAMHPPATIASLISVALLVLAVGVVTGLRAYMQRAYMLEVASARAS